MPSTATRRLRRPPTNFLLKKLPAPDADVLAKTVYGLPELYADALPNAQIVANPGCYPTSVILGLRPLVEAGWIDFSRGIVRDCKSGVTGAGKEPKRETHFVEVNENFRAYNLFTHRHTPEVSDHLGLGLDQFVFTTHDTNLLDLDLLRRDEIWFVEKDQNGASSLYSLAEFKVRDDLKIEKGYLNGRFGAIPFIGDLSRIGLLPAKAA